jgi:hypothetical protein
MIDEQELQAYSERATDELMQIFNDPFFEEKGSCLEMQEIDF